MSISDETDHALCRIREDLYFVQRGVGDIPALTRAAHALDKLVEDRAHAKQARVKFVSVASNQTSRGVVTLAVDTRGHIWAMDEKMNWVMAPSPTYDKQPEKPLPGTPVPG